MPLIILPGQGKTIALETAKGSPVENEQNAEVPLSDQHWDKVFSDKHFTAEPRAQMTGRYNCHGMTFGCRRTRIYSHQEIVKIIHDDGYKEVSMQNVLAGDYILYVGNGEFDHSGIVICPPTAENLWNPLVVSKWGSGREYIHRGNDCPYGFTVKYYRVDNE